MNVDINDELYNYLKNYKTIPINNVILVDFCETKMQKSTNILVTLFSLIVHVVDILSFILTGPLNEMFDNMICFCIIKSIIVNFKKMNELPG